MTEDVKKTDATAPCPKCGGVMKIATVERIENDDGHMLHRFQCDCGERAAFRFRKG